MLYNIVLTYFNVTGRVVSHQFEYNWFIITALCALRLFQAFPNFLGLKFVSQIKPADKGVKSGCRIMFATSDYYFYFCRHFNLLYIIYET